MNAPIPELRPRCEQAREESFQVSLLEEPLALDQAGLDVLELLAAMRKYHHLRDLSHRERAGAPDRQSRQALSQLGDVQRSLQELVSGMGGDEGRVIVEASLNVRMVAKPSA